MGSDWYKLDGHTPVRCAEGEIPNYDIQYRRVALDERGGVSVSTVFLGLDHSHCSPGPPILFETLVTGGRLDQTMLRYATWEEAEAGHAATVKEVFAWRLELQGRYEDLDEKKS